MSELSHLDELEAEAIYIIREVALLDWKGQRRNASSGNEGILSGEATISIFTCKHNMEIQGNDRIP